MSNVNESQWAGYLTPDNLHAVAERVERMLEGKRFTIVNMNHAYTRNGQLPPSLKVEAGQRMYASWTDDAPGDPNAPIHVHELDLRGEFGFHVGGCGLLVLSSKRNQSYVDMDAFGLDYESSSYSPEASSAVYVSFVGQIEIRFVYRAPARNRVETVLAIDAGQ